MRVNKLIGIAAQPTKADNRPLMNVDDRMGSCRDKGADVGQGGGLVLVLLATRSLGDLVEQKVAPGRGQAQGPLIHSTSPLVPTGPWAASTSMDRITPFGRQNSSSVPSPFTIPWIVC